MTRARKLLLVDDDRLILATTGNGLRAAGYQVFEASSAERALDALGGFEPDMMLIDIRMSGIDGFGLAASLREQGDIPFMFVSAYGDDETVERATELGAVGFVVKPVDITHLIPAIEAALARAADLARLRADGRRLEAALDQQRGVNVAIGILMERHRLTREFAQERLRDVARSSRRKMSEVANQIVSASEILAAAGLARKE